MNMKREYFNIGNYKDIYQNIDHLNPDDLENITGNNLFLAFLKENGETSLNCIAALDNQIYNFNAHKYINENTEILYARSFSEIMPSNIWRLTYIVNHDLITIDIDDYKYYLFEQFGEMYNGVTDKNAKKIVLQNSYKMPKLKPLNRENLKNINGSNIFLAILEKSNIQKENSYLNQSEIMQITYEGIDTTAKILRSMIENKNLTVKEGVNIDQIIEYYKIEALENLNRYWYIKLNENSQTANFIASINGRIYNFCTGEYLNYYKTDINYATPLNWLIPDNKWKLSYSKSGNLTCLTVDEDMVDVLIDFQNKNSDKIDKEAKTKVLRNGYKINIGG